MEKHLSFNFHIWKNGYHRDFIQISVRMEVFELYDKKFLIYGNCVIGCFGQPGIAQIETELKSETKEKLSTRSLKAFHFGIYFVSVG